MKRLMGTGHRPDKLGGYSQAVNDKLKKTAVHAIMVTLDLIEGQDPNETLEVISGMALGWDMALAEATIEMRLPLICAIPFKGQELKWPKESQDRYNRILSEAAGIHYICPAGYAAWKMQTRNAWMVDHSNRIASLHDGSPGGTFNCLEYNRLTRKLPVDNYWGYFNRLP